MNVKCINSNSIYYPYLLKQISDFPSNIYGKGDLDLLSKRCITIVGTRNITEYGREVLKDFLSKDLKGLDLVFVSGLAIGIDTEVHKLCLENDLKTIAVVAGGLNMGFPKINKGLYKEICKKGLVLAEYPLDFNVEKYMFAKRNRIMAGLSDTVIVIESKLKSGSLVTAQLALDYNRDVYVVPGEIGKETSQGCNMLIRQGAGVITNREDFLGILSVKNEQINFRCSV